MDTEAPQAEDQDRIFRQLGALNVGSHLELVNNEYLRFDLRVGPVVVPALLWLPQRANGRLIVLTNGTVARNSAKAPTEVFQRRTWVDDIQAPSLFLADPTLQPENAISIGWGQGIKGKYAIPAMAQTVRFVGEALGVGGAGRLYYGSSAGGFQALQLAARDEGSTAVVNNPQIDWTTYKSHFVKTICSYSYDNMDPESIRSMHPDRLSVAAAFDALDYVPKFQYLVNIASENDRQWQLPALLDNIPKIDRLLDTSRIEISAYYDSNLGHHPLPRSRTVREINSALARLGRR